jgi:flagellar P-ring protein FlgI
MSVLRGRMPLLSWIAVLLALCCVVCPAQAQVKLRDLVSIEGVRGNQLVGYGLVIGLHATGDTLRNSPFTQQSLNAMLERMGVNVNDQKLQTRNTAAVVVTAILPPFARQGTPIDVQVSSLGDAKSLQGGTLMVTPLMGADGEVYAVSQGPIIVGGITVAGAAQSVKEGVTTSGRVPGGGLVEREIANHLDGMSTLRLALRNPDFTTAERIEQALNARLGPGAASAQDLGTVDVHVPPQYYANMTALIANIEQIPVVTDEPA